MLSAKVNPSPTSVRAYKVVVRSVAQVRSRERRRVVVLAVLVALVTAILAWLLPRSLLGAFGFLGAVVLAPAALYWLWERPVRGVYILFAAALLQETDYGSVVYPDDLGYYTPIFQDIATWSHISGISFSIAELFMVLMLLIWLLKGLAARSFRFDKGSLMRPLALYIALVVIGEGHGLATGGDFKLSLWEVRSQAYMFIAYVLACNLVRTRKELNVLVWSVIVGGGIKGIQGCVRYYLEPHGHLETLLSHEQSFFWNAALTLTAILFLYGGSRRLKTAALVFLPFILIADIANNRRAGVVALGVGIVTLLVVTVVAHPARRRVALAILCLGAILWLPYYSVYKTKDGLIAEPARAVYSNSHPDPRDASSNLYRDNENADLIFTMKSSLLNEVIGFGFGKRFYTPHSLDVISGAYIFYNLLPHNSILWIWMRVGSIGFFIFWVLIATAIMQAMQLAIKLREPYLKGLAVFIGVMIMQQILRGYCPLV